MTTKYLITTSIFSLISISIAQAADVIVPEQPVPVVAVPAFSWAGFYLGGQVGNFSSKTALSYLGDEKTGKWTPVKKEFVPKLSGFVGGIYAGSNFDINNGFIIGIDTDVMWSGKKNTKIITWPEVPPEVSSEKKVERVSIGTSQDTSAEVTNGALSHTLKQKWFGATRVKVGFVVDRMMPYIAGGVAYTQLQNIFEKEADKTKKAIDISDVIHDEKKTMVGYTLGGGIDFAMTDNVIVRAEYRYSDYGKKKFADEKIEMRYKTNDFRVGVAYKF
ncbi:hemin-binding protein E [Bartonella henselae]|uniref:Hemin binding protein D n=1 Tax=Bartonella henselae TaxID=38323 RepID=X5MEW9_BARHN|nr:outer membrane protein [Bartonella henselae]MDM9997254.1 porin family protein [Bartonella henselae]OLL48464.1 hemin-binding protein E [Bartonella henselae]OLL48792.1 hemin-binding protein E [Bartonella henselae]OLL49885.1 hemin-binding protein E [Bartonella henselae]OLL57439.1 hemin-binding protein E [Bartonella henselae]